MTRTPATFDTLLRDLPEAWTAATEGPGAWSPWMPRLKMILEHGVERPFEPFDRESQFSQSAGKSLSTLLDAFSALCLENLEELRALDLQPAQLEKKGMHPAPWSGDSTAASGGLLAGISFGNALG